MNAELLRQLRGVEQLGRAVAASLGYLSSLVPIGNGELAILKEGTPA